MKNALTFLMVFFVATSAYTKGTPLSPTPLFTIKIELTKAKKSYTLSCKPSGTCETQDTISVFNQRQPLRIVLDLAAPHRSPQSSASFYAPQSHRYNLTIDTGAEGSFLETAHFAKKGTLPPYKTVSFRAPLTYWYKKGGRELKKILDQVRVTITPS